MRIVPFWHVRWFFSVLGLSFKLIYWVIFTDADFKTTHHAMEEDLKRYALKYKVDWHHFNE